MDIMLSNSQNIKNKPTEEVKVLRGPPQDLADRIKSSLNATHNQSIKAEFDGKSQEIEVSMFQTSMNKVFSVKEENDENLNSHDLKDDSIFGSNLNNTQNLGRKEFKPTKSQLKEINNEMKKDYSEVSFSMLENDDNKSELNFLKM